MRPLMKLLKEKIEESERNGSDEKAREYQVLYRDFKKKLERTDETSY